MPAPIAVALLTAGLRHVAWVEIPPFSDAGLPEVLLWDHRAFMRCAKFDDGHWAYREVFVYVSLTPPPGIGLTEH